MRKNFFTSLHLRIQNWRLANGNIYWWWFYWKILEPIITLLFGYFPSKKLGMFDDLPKAFADEWRNWCLEKDYMCYKPEVKKMYNDVKFPILAYSFSDDKFANLKSIQEFHRLFTNTPILHRHFRPADLNVKSVGHTGFFKQQFKDNLWSEAYEFISKGTLPPSKL